MKHVFEKQGLKYSAEEEKQRSESAEKLDAFMGGFCTRCGRKRTECQKIIDSGKRCTES
jgi:hypothetical protein